MNYHRNGRVPDSAADPALHATEDLCRKLLWCARTVCCRVQEIQCFLGYNPEWPGGGECTQ